MRLLSALLIGLLMLPAFAHAEDETVGVHGFKLLKKCVMENEPYFCHTILTENSHGLLDRFLGYKLMPCLPTDFVYEEEKPAAGGYTVVKSSLPAGPNKKHVFRLAFTRIKNEILLDIPESLRIGFGEQWQEKVQLAEQIYLLMKSQSGDRLTCDQLTGLLKNK